MSAHMFNSTELSDIDREIKGVSESHSSEYLSQIQHIMKAMTPSADVELQTTFKKAHGYLLEALELGSGDYMPIKTHMATTEGMEWYVTSLDKSSKELSAWSAVNRTLASASKVLDFRRALAQVPEKGL